MSEIKNILSEEHHMEINAKRELTAEELETASGGISLTKCPKCGGTVVIAQGVPQHTCGWNPPSNNNGDTPSNHTITQCPKCGGNTISSLIVDGECHVCRNPNIIPNLNQP